jgi:hypothetical protein
MTRVEIVKIADAAVSIQGKIEQVRNLLYTCDSADDMIFMRMHELDGSIGSLNDTLRYMLETNHEPITAPEIRP